jgi:hypothetical protein
MGWTAYHKDGTVLNEGEHGRPVQAGEEGQLSLITQEDFGHKIAIDLNAGVIAIDYDAIDAQGGNIAIANPKTVLYVCDDTNIAGELFGLKKGRPNKEGWFKQTVVPLTWRPIWFTRHTNENQVKVIGLQTTLKSPYKRHNVKKLVCLFDDGRIGIY